MQPQASAGADWATPLLRMPLYVIQSRADELVPVAETEQVVQTLKGRGAEVSMALIDDVPHHMVSGYIDALEAATPWIRSQWDR